MFVLYFWVIGSEQMAVKSFRSNYNSIRLFQLFFLKTILRLLFKKYDNRS